MHSGETSMGIKFIKAGNQIGPLGNTVAVPAHYASDGHRPGSHLKLGGLEAIIKDVAAKGAMNAPEQDLIIEYKAVGQNAKKAAKRITVKNFLSGNGYAVCHKIPYASFEKLLLQMMNLHISGNPPNWVLLELLLQDAGVSSTDASNWTNNLSGLVQAGTKQNQAAAAANNILLRFDACDDNLYLGFSTTNSSIGQNIDGHYNVLSPSPAPANMTPRGNQLWTRLNQCEQAVGLTVTKAIEVVDTVGLKWQMTSSAYGKKSQDAGYVYIN